VPRPSASPDTLLPPSSLPAPAPPQLDFKVLWATANSAEEAADHPGNPAAKVLDPSYWEALPLRPGAAACGLHARFGWCVHRTGCPFDHPEDAPKVGGRRRAGGRAGLLLVCSGSWRRARELCGQRPT
jgi:hypothetical protein